MMRASFAILGAMLFASSVESANPIRKVVKLMQEMQKEIEVEKQKEKELFEKFMCICTEYPPELRESIEEGTKTVSLLTSKIEEESANKEKLEQELISHKQEKGSAEKDLNQATMLREKEAAEYEATLASTKASVDGLGKAITSLAKGATSAMLQQTGGVPRLQAMVETSSFVSSFDRQRVVAFLTGSASNGESAPSSGEVLGILKQMKADMESTLTEAEEAEKVAVQGYADLKSAKDKEIEVAAESVEAKEKKSGEFEVSIAQSSDSLDDTKAEIKDSQAMLSLLEGTCTSRKAEWEARLKMRDDEIAAISEAITILNDDDALDVFKKAVPGDAPAASGFLQTRHGKSFAVQGLQKAVDIVKDALKTKSHSAKLELLMYKMKTQLRYAQSSNAKEFPDMTGVAKMTEDMIAVLKSEMTADENKKTWCTEELEKSEAEKTRKQEVLDQATAAIAQTEDEIASADEEIKTLEKEIVDIDKEVAGSTEQRKKEHSEYTENLQMTDVAISLLEKAKNRLQKFYNPTLYKAPPKKEATMEEKITASYAFVQRHSSLRQPKAMPDLPDIPKYEKQNSGGVISLMDEITKQLEMDKVESGHEEKTAQKEYVEFMADAQINRAQDAKSVVQKKATKAELEKRLVVLKEDAKTMSEEVFQAHQLIAEVHNACDFVLETFKERAAARAGEIESLENAKSVLEGAANLMAR